MYTTDFVELSIKENELAFHQLEQIQISSPSGGDNDSYECWLVAESSVHGALFVANGSCIQVLNTKSIESLKRDSKNVIQNFNTHNGFQVDGQITSLHLNCNKSLLAVGLQKAEKILEIGIFYTDDVLYKQAKAPHITVPVSGKLLDLQWNPGESYSHMLAICLSDGSLALWEIQEQGRLVGQIAGINPFSLCWSPKGKQLVVGCGDGNLRQFDQALKVKKEIPLPQELSSSVPISLFWLATSTFVVAMFDCNPDSQPQLLVINLPKGQPIEYTNFGDVCLGTKDSSPWKYFFHFIPEWNILVLASSTSPEVAILARSAQNTKTWEVWSLYEDFRAALPMTPTHEDTFPVGFAVTYAYEKPLRVSSEKRIPPCPVLSMLSTNGILTSYLLVNQFPETAILTHPPAKPLRPLSNQSPRVPKTSALPAIGAVQPKPIPRQLNFGTAGVSSTSVRNPDIKLSAKPMVQREKPATTMQQTTLVYREESLSNPLIPSPPAVSVKPTPAVQSPSRKEKAQLVSQESERIYGELVHDEMQAFEEKMLKLRQKLASLDMTSAIGTGKEKAELQNKITEVSTFSDELKTVTSNQNSKVVELKDDCLNLFAMVEDCKEDSQRPLGEVDKKPLNPLAKKALDGVKNRFARVQSKAKSFEKDPKKPLAQLYEVADVYKVIGTNYHLIFGLDERLQQLQNETVEVSRQKLSLPKRSPKSKAMDVDAECLWRQVETHGVVKVCRTEEAVKEESPLVAKAKAEIQRLHDAVEKMSREERESILSQTFIHPRRSLADRVDKRLSTGVGTVSSDAADLPKAREILNSLSAIRQEARKVSPVKPFQPPTVGTRGQVVASPKAQISTSTALVSLKPSTVGTQAHSKTAGSVTSQVHPKMMDPRVSMPAVVSPQPLNLAQVQAEIREGHPISMPEKPSRPKPGLLGFKPGDAPTSSSFTQIKVKTTTSPDVVSTATKDSEASNFFTSLLQKSPPSRSEFSAATTATALPKPSSAIVSTTGSAEPVKPVPDTSDFTPAVQPTFTVKSTTVGSIFSGTGIGSSPAAASSGIFGDSPKTTAASSIFGAIIGSTAPTTTSTTALFGSPTLSGHTATVTTPTVLPTGNLFGTSSASTTGTSLFGGPAATTPPGATGIFGTSANAAKSPPSLFGGGTTTPTTAGGSAGIFGGLTPATPATAAAGSLFGSTPAATTTSSALFGSDSGSIFGSGSSGDFLSGLGGSTPSSATTTNIFGKPTVTPPAPSATGSIFGATNQQSSPFGATGSIFGKPATTAAPTSSTFGGFGGSPSFGQQQQPSGATGSIFGSGSPFGGKATFGGGASFGSGAVFGSSLSPKQQTSPPSHVFGAASSIASEVPSFGAAGMTDSNRNPSFGSLAQGAPAFGGQSTGAFGDTTSFGGGQQQPSFTAHRG